jgi:hypothetical protein
MSSSSHRHEKDSPPEEARDWAALHRDILVDVRLPQAGILLRDHAGGGAHLHGLATRRRRRTRALAPHRNDQDHGSRVVLEPVLGDG